MISIIILNRNGETWLKPLYESIIGQTCADYEVILVDNDSSDRSLEMTRAYPRVQVAAFTRNLGYAPAYNLASTLARGDYLLMLNNDTILAANFVEVMTAAVRRTKARLLTPTVKNYEGTNAGYCGLNIDLVGYPGAHPLQRPFYADGCALMIDATLFRALGGFDRDYFMYGEDVDLSWRAHLAGEAITCVPEAIVRHFGGGVSVPQAQVHTFARTMLWKRYLSERNRLSNLLKNFGWPALAMALPAYFAINTCAMAALIVLGQFRLAAVFIRVWSWHLRNLPHTLRKRRIVQKRRRVSDSVILSRIESGSNQWRVLFQIGMPIEVATLT
jgi:GT2 family glycosyltransferase